MVDWKVGQRCVIVDTANVLARCPELVGSVGIVAASGLETPGGQRGIPTRGRPVHAGGPGGTFWVRTPTARVGEVRALPRAPSKWIDVLVCDGRIIKFQTSALSRGRAEKDGVRSEKGRERDFFDARPV